MHEHLLKTSRETPCFKQDTFFFAFLLEGERGRSHQSDSYSIPQKSCGKKKKKEKKIQKHVFLPDMRVVEWTGARGFLTLLSGFGPKPVSGNVDETGQPAHMPGGL